VTARLQEHFKPELRNRLDEQIIFHALSRASLRQIVDLQLTRVRARAGENGVDLEITEAARELLTEAGHDPAFGARPLRRSIQRLLLDPLADHLLVAPLRAAQTVRADVSDGRIVLTTAE